MSRLVRWQLVLFCLVTVVSIVVMAVWFMRVPDKAGLGRYQVAVDLTESGGLYATSNVTFLGQTVGRVQRVEVTPEGARAYLDLASGVRVPADSRAEVHSRSAIGEQFLDLIPPVTAPGASASGPNPAQASGTTYLANGSVIPASRTSVPQDIAPLLDDLDATLAGVPNDKLGDLLTQSADAFGGNGENMSRLLDAFHAFTADAKANLVPTEKLITDLMPVLQSQQVSSDAIRRWALNLAQLTGQLTGRNDASVRAIIEQGPGAMGQANALFQQFRPTLPLLLANLVSLGEVGVTYNPSLEQILVAIPQGVSELATIAVPNMGGTNRGFLSFNTSTLNSVPPCTTGFLPASARRDGSAVDSPTRTSRDLYCALPQNSQVAVRGARNLPCMMKPGKRAPTVKICKSPYPYRPLGTNPWYGNPTPTTNNGATGGPIQPSGYRPDFSDGGLTGAAYYDPRTGFLVDTDGNSYRQQNLKKSDGKARTWQQMMPTA
jgi:phospholipid/cholesterol/gamma-HCH transport system substrate-binding protein